MKLSWMKKHIRQQIPRKGMLFLQVREYVFSSKFDSLTLYLFAWQRHSTKTAGKSKKSSTNLSLGSLLRCAMLFFLWEVWSVCRHTDTAGVWRRSISDLATVQRFRLAPDWAGFCRCVKMNQFHFDSVQIRVECPDTWHRTVSSVLIWFLRSPAWWSRFFCVCVWQHLLSTSRTEKLDSIMASLRKTATSTVFIPGREKVFFFFISAEEPEFYGLNHHATPLKRNNSEILLSTTAHSQVYQTRIIIPCFNWMMKDKARALFRQTIRRAVNEDGLSEQNQQQQPNHQTSNAKSRTKLAWWLGLPRHRPGLPTKAN